MIKHVIWASMIDYPGNTSAVLFTGACNFNCDYCYNKTLKGAPDKVFDKEILPKLLERKDFVDHVIISGGEPTIDPEFEHMLEVLNKEGFKVGVHTNGANPDKIINNIDKIDYLGIDIKSSFDRYDVVAGTRVNVDNVKKTIEFVVKSGKHYEFRTTLFPRDVKKKDAISIANYLKEIGAEKYHLQQFYPVNGAENVKSYSEKEIVEIRDACNNVIPTVLKTK